MRPVRPTAIAIAIAALLGGCDGGVVASTVPSATTATEATASAATSVAAATISVGKTIWFAGFKLELGEATSQGDASGGTVSIAARFENPGDSDQRLDATITLASAGTTYSPDDLSTDIPDVPAGGTGKGTLAFRVESDFAFDDAVLTFGRPSNNQAVVPLGTTGTFVSLEPVTLSVAGTGSAGSLQLDLTSGELRADLPDSYGEVETGHLVLTITYNATFNSNHDGGFAFTGENVALRLPDGTTVGPRQDGRSQSLELLGARTTTKDLFSRFEIDDPAAGQYVFIVRDGDLTAEIPITVP